MEPPIEAPEDLDLSDGVALAGDRYAKRLHWLSIIQRQMESTGFSAQLISDLALYLS